MEYEKGKKIEKCIDKIEDVVGAAWEDFNIGAITREKLILTLKEVRDELKEIIEV